MNFYDFKHKDLTEKIINAFFKVYNNLGHGFLEKVYENARVVELSKMGMPVDQQQRINVIYEGIIVGDYFADLIVNDRIIVELKCAESLREDHEFQLINYLKATEIEVGLLFNFGKKPEFRRMIYSNKKY